MKMYGSNHRDTLIGTASRDTIQARGGNDLIATAGGADTILAGDGDDMITGFSFKLSSDDGGTDPDIDIGIGSQRASAGQSMLVDGGAGSHDIMLVELTAQKGISEIETFREKVTVKNVEEFIYNFASLTADQKILGANNTRGLETIVVGSGTADIDSQAGNDFIYTSSGADVIKAGNGRDFIHAGEGHNFVSGEAGADYFHFQLTGNYQYTEITDFQAGQDKILITVSTDQINLLFGAVYEDWESLDPDIPVRYYGDGLQGVGSALNDYVSYNHGRQFDPSEFTQNDDVLYLPLWVDYETETGSVFAYYYTQVDDALDIDKVLIAHVTPGTDIAASDIQLFRL
jgi:Ca2+-binding RTX toxin-like protein